MFIIFPRCLYGTPYGGKVLIPLPNPQPPPLLLAPATRTYRNSAFSFFRFLFSSMTSWASIAFSLARATFPIYSHAVRSPISNMLSCRLTVYSHAVRSPISTCTPADLLSTPRRPISNLKHALLPTHCLLARRPISNVKHALLQTSSVLRSKRPHSQTVNTVILSTRTPSDLQSQTCTLPSNTHRARARESTSRARGQSSPHFAHFAPIRCQRSSEDQNAPHFAHFSPTNSQTSEHLARNSYY